MASLTSVFKQVFGEGLKEEGFVKIKGGQPYLVRVVTEDIIQLIAVRNYGCGEGNSKKFEILGGLATVYRRVIDLKKSPSYNINWLSSLPDFHQYVDLAGFNNDYCVKLMSFKYYTDNENSLTGEMNYALAETKKVMLPVFKRVHNLRDCMEYFDMLNLGCFIWKKYDSEIGWFEDYDYSEFLLDIQTDNHGDLKELFEKKFQEILKSSKAGRGFLGYRSCSDAQARLEDYRQNILKRRDFVYANSDVYKRVKEELRVRKIKNTEVLKSYGLDI